VRYYSVRHGRTAVGAAAAAHRPLTAPAIARIDAPADGEHPGGRIVVPGAAPRSPETASYPEGIGRLLDLIATRMPRREVEAVWVFPGVRREGREYGVAVVSRLAAEDRRRVYRARYVLQVKGQERGTVTLELEETAVTRPELLTRVLEGVRRRADEAGEAEPLDLTAWKAPADDGAVAE
jgi:hypothetical protein